MKPNRPHAKRATAPLLPISRPPPGSSAYVFVACLGIWLPRLHAATLVDLDATQLPTGPLPTWTNAVSAVGNFAVPSGATVPAITEVDGVKGVAFLATGGANGGTHYLGPVVPAQLNGAGPRTVEAWIHNPTPQNEEVVFDWGARNTPAPGPTGENVSFGHGLSPAFGAVAMWGAPDIGWGNNAAEVATNMVFNRWTYIAFTYDGTTSRVFVDGREANNETIAINTRELDTAGNPLRFRIARQNNPAGAIDGTGLGQFTLGRLRVQDTALDPAAIQARFDQEKTVFGLGDTDNDGMPDWFERRYSAVLNLNDASDAAKDADNDGLTNLVEFQKSTVPNNPDTDGDGLSDGAEVNRTVAGQVAATDPLRADTDSDGLSDKVETSTGVFVNVNDPGSDPLKADTDGDGFGDLQEVFSASDPNKPASVPAADRPSLVNLDAANLVLGPLAAWPNSGTMGSVFNSPTNAPGRVQTIQGVKGVTLDGVNNYYTGPAAPAFVTGNSSRTIEAWIYNPVPADEETIFAWGRRGGPDGSNTSFNHGLNAAFGAIGHWGGPDIGWNGQIARGQWTYVAYSYDGPTRTTTVYKDGEQANTETLANPLNTHTVDTANRPLPFRVGSQTDANGNPTAALRGSMTIAEIRVYDRVLDPTVIQNNFTAGTDKYGLADYDNDALPTWYERQYSFLNPRDASDASKDQDTDGLANLAEFQRGTEPDNPDTDGDGASDGAEVNRTTGGQAAATDPLRQDTDGDGLSDKAETGTGTFVSPTNTGTNPLAVDSDSDGSVDGLEVYHGSNPNSTASTPNVTTPALLVSLDATALAVGPLPAWQNAGVLGGVFKAPADSVANVESVQGVKGVTLDGVGNFYTGPEAPVFLTGNASRTVEAWIFNPAAADEETIFSWGRRGGPAGSNCSFNHGLNAAFGAVGHWDAPDIGWGGTTNVIVGKWTYVAYTYDGSTMTTTVYKEGVQANREVLTAALDTWDIDNTTQGAPLPFRVGSQNNNNGTPTPNLRGSMTIARVRVHDLALSAQAIQAKYDEEKAFFSAPPAELKIQSATFDRASGSFTITWTASPGRTYAVETSTNLTDWTQVAGGQTTGTFTDRPAAGSAPARFYRLRVQ
ncbi:MAG: hypothetical protein HY735_14090 [Verrucomicrobia bacterium]|nr:hypothetical protein [Verrucomicrobiota bacterium]